MRGREGGREGEVGRGAAWKRRGHSMVLYTRIGSGKKFKACIHYLQTTPPLHCHY